MMFGNYFSNIYIIYIDIIKLVINGFLTLLIFLFIDDLIIIIIPLII